MNLRRRATFRLAPAPSDAATPERLLGLTIVALTVACAVFTANLIWALAAPIGPLGAPATARTQARAALDPSVLVRFDPFFRAPTASSDPASELAQLGLTLFAVRVGGPDGGAAVIQIPGEGQRSVSIGETVTQGVTVQQVTADYAVLARGGATFRLDFPNARPDPGAREPGVGDLRIARTVDPAAFMAELALQARIVNGEVTGYTLRDGHSGPVMQRLGLQPGDVLVAVNNHRLTDDDRVAELAQELTSRPEAVIRYERNGEVRTATVRIAPP